MLLFSGKLMACGDNQDNKLGINKIVRKGAKAAKCGETFTFKPVYGLSSVAVRVRYALFSLSLKPNFDTPMLGGTVSSIEPGLGLKGGRIAQYISNIPAHRRLHAEWTTR